MTGRAADLDRGAPARIVSPTLHGDVVTLNWAEAKAVPPETIWEAKLSFEHPMTVTNPRDLARVKARIAGRLEPQYSAWQALRADADRALKFDPQPPAKMYLMGGYEPHSNSRAQGAVLIGSGQAVYACALGWALSGEEVYAAKAVAILDAWVRADTEFTGKNRGLQLAAQFTTMLYAADLLQGEPISEGTTLGRRRPMTPQAASSARRIAHRLQSADRIAGGQAAQSADDAEVVPPKPARRNPPPGFPGYQGWHQTQRRAFEAFWRRRVLPHVEFVLFRPNNWGDHALMGEFAAAIAFEDVPMARRCLARLNDYYFGNWKIRRDDRGTFLLDEVERNQGHSGITYTAFALSAITQALEMARNFGPEFDWWRRRTTADATMQGLCENYFRWNNLREPFPWYDENFKTGHPKYSDIRYNILETAHTRLPGLDPRIETWLKANRPVKGMEGDPCVTLLKGDL